MKIIDTHTHLPGFAFGLKPKTAEQLRREFESSGISSAWLMTVDGLLGQVQKNNDILAETVKKDNFFIPFCSVNPHLGEDASIEELHRAKYDLKMKGLKLHPWLQAFSVTHHAVIPIVKEAGKLNMPVLFHDGTPPYSSTMQIAWLAEKCPDTTIILGHSGLDYLYLDAITASQRYRNIILCGCSISSGFLNHVITQCDEDRIIFGSDAGIAPEIIEYAIDKYLCLNIDNEKLEKIFYKNALRIIPQN